MLFPPKSKSYGLKTFDQATKRRGGWETKSVSPSLYLGLSGKWPNISQEIWYFQNFMEDWEYAWTAWKRTTMMSVCTKNFQDIRLENCRSINFIWGFPFFPPNTRAMFFPDCHQQHGGRNKNRNAFANTWKENVPCSGTAIWRASPARLD